MPHQRHICLFTILLLLFSGNLFAEETPWEIRSETIFQGFESTTSIDEKSLVFPVYEYIAGDYGNVQSEGISFHIQGWGRHDLASTDYYQKNTDGKLLYGYLTYQPTRGKPIVTIGRQRILMGDTDEYVDGLKVESPFLSNFFLSAYAGVPSDDGGDEQRGNQKIYGAGCDYHFNSAYHIGFSYQTITGTGTSAAEQAGVTFASILPGSILFSGNSLYNLTTDEWAVHNYSITYQAGDLTFQPFFRHFRYDAFFDDTADKSSPFRYLADSGDALTETGGDVIWRQFENPLEVGCTFKHYAYSEISNTNIYYSGFINLVPESFDTGCEVGMMDGDDPKNRFLLGRFYISTRTIPFISDSGSLSTDLTYVHYDEPVYDTSESFYAVVNCQHYFYHETAEVIISGRFSRDPYYDSDFGGSIIISCKLDNWE